jgi:hypothetical protein
MTGETRTRLGVPVVIAGGSLVGGSHAQFEPDAAVFRDLADVPSDLPPGVAC